MCKLHKSNYKKLLKRNYKQHLYDFLFYNRCSIVDYYAHYEVAMAVAEKEQLNNSSSYSGLDVFGGNSYEKELQLCKEVGADVENSRP